MHGLGIDFLEIERLERVLRRWPKLTQRLYSEQELTYAHSKARPGQHLAARFCAKEAVAKALALSAWRARDIEVVQTGGAPHIRLQGELGRYVEASGLKIELSLTHDRGMAGAVAIAIAAHS